jgi:catechol 2,3-dioxygenase-like lactoylglutathione lyase family enzyme
MPVVKDVVPTFFVADVRRSADWYVRVLGFTTAFIAEEPGQLPSYGGVELGPARIHLAQLQTTPPGMAIKGACYLRLERGVDEYIARIEATGQPLASALKDHDYGMREATVRDPDGNDLYIGQAISRSTG